MSIRSRASDILDIPIRAGRWVTYTEALDREGKFDRRKILDLLMACCEYIEEAEGQVARLESLINQQRDLIKAFQEATVTVTTGPTTTPLDDAPQNVTVPATSPTKEPASGKATKRA